MVSVIIPTYNRAYTIQRSIESVLNQSFKDFELIIVDDGSSDNTEEIVNGIKDSRIRYIKQSNAGAAAARNTGVCNAKYDYIAFQDSDDYWYPDKLRKQVEALKNNKADVVFCKLRRINYGDGNDILPDIGQGFVTFDKLLRQPMISTQTLFGKKEVFVNYPFDEDLQALEDYAFSFAAARQYTFYHIADVLVDLYLQENSLTADMKKYYQSSCTIMEKYCDIWDQYPEIAANRYYIQGCLAQKIGINDVSAFQKSWQLKKGVRVFLKLILTRLRIL